MRSFSVWHWLVFLLLGLGIYGVYRLAKGRAPNSVGNQGPKGVGGWLLFLVVGLMVLGPLMGAARLNSDLMSAEAQYPKPDKPEPNRLN